MTGAVSVAATMAHHMPAVTSGVSRTMAHHMPAVTSGVSRAIAHHMLAVTSGVSTSIATVWGNLASFKLKIDSLQVHLGTEISDLFLQGSDLFYIRVGCIQQGVEFLRFGPDFVSEFSRVVEEFLF
jgi:hypothetical protein